MPDLGQLEKVDLRSVWTDEAGDFTPWLASEENLDLLGDTIGIELELDSTEKSVGPFNADILCKDTIDDQWVLIENQLERTDHPHLGQLLTYAAGLNAVTIVWIARRFSDQHRSALDWLNDITEEGINFFGLEIELWKIGDSPPAPKFNTVSAPNDWSDKVSSATSDRELSEIKQLQLEYWTHFKEYLEEHNDTVTPRKPQPRHWSTFAIGRTNCRLSARMNTHADQVSVDLNLTDREEAKPLFHLLKEEQAAIEDEIGYELDWGLQPDNKRSLISLRWDDQDATDQSQWKEQFELLSEGLTRFYKAFYPRPQDLDPDDWESKGEAQRADLHEGKEEMQGV